MPGCSPLLYHISAVGAKGPYGQCRQNTTGENGLYPCCSPRSWALVKLPFSTVWAKPNIEVISVSTRLVLPQFDLPNTIAKEGVVNDIAILEQRQGAHVAEEGREVQPGHQSEIVRVAGSKHFPQRRPHSFGSSPAATLRRSKRRRHPIPRGSVPRDSIAVRFCPYQ